MNDLKKVRVHLVLFPLFLWMIFIKGFLNNLLISQYNFIIIIEHPFLYKIYKCKFTIIFRYIKLWNTETGQVISRFTSRKIPYCVKFNPDKNRQHLFVAGTSDKKIICWDIRSGDIVQEYDRHLGAVNSITFVDENRRFVTTSDDKSLRVWEWDIPVDMKYIADPTMHSMPSVTPAPNGKLYFCETSHSKYAEYESSLFQIIIEFIILTTINKI